MLTLHVEDLWHKATEVLRFITVPEHPQLFSSAQEYSIHLTMLCVGWEATEKFWWDGDEQPGLDADGILLKHRGCHLKGITSKTSQQDR